MKCTIPFLFAALSLSACSKIVMSTAAMLGAQNPLTPDPASSALAIDIPDGVDVAQDGAVMKFQNINTVHDVNITKSYAFQRVEDSDQSIFAIDPADLPELRAYQTRITQWERKDPAANSGSFSVWVRFCVIGDGPDPDDTFSVAVRLTPDGTFKPLIRNASVQDAIDRVEVNGGSINETRPCAE